MIATMRRTLTLLALVCTSLSLSACKGTPVAWKPEIVFLGIATDTLGGALGVAGGLRGRDPGNLRDIRASSQ